MDDDSAQGCSPSCVVDHFSIERIRKDDPRLQEFEIAEEEKQSSFSAYLQLISGSNELEIEDVNTWNHLFLTDEDFNRLRAIGLKGKLRFAGWGTLGYPPYKARTIIVAQHQIREAVDLPQPNACDVIYYQVGDEWRRFPSDVPVLKKRFRLSIDQANENWTNIWEEAYFGSSAGGGGSIGWPAVMFPK
jgi:hypothetical protein